MKQILFIILFVFVLLFLSTANASLVDNDDGTVTQTRNDDSRLMWLQDANLSMTSNYDSDGLMTWTEANTNWITYLNTTDFDSDGTIGYANYNDWRLPTTLPANGLSYNYIYSTDGSTDIGHNIISPNSEMSYMFHVELENLDQYDTNGNPQPGWGLVNTEPFDNFQTPPDSIYYFWSGTVVDNPDFPDRAWLFEFNSGSQGYNGFGYERHAWAVRDMSPIPIPSAVWLLGSGLIGIVGVRRKFKK
jgi:hypothetical protein